MRRWSKKWLAQPHPKLAELGPKWNVSTLNTAPLSCSITVGWWGSLPLRTLQLLAVIELGNCSECKAIPLTPPPASFSNFEIALHQTFEPQSVYVKGCCQNPQMSSSSLSCSWGCRCMGVRAFRGRMACVSGFEQQSGLKLLEAARMPTSYLTGDIFCKAVLTQLPHIK